MKSNLFLLIQVILLGVFFPSFASAQQGILTGTVLDKSSGESMIGVIVEVRRNDTLITGAATDFDGNFTFNLHPGVYEIAFKYLSYSTLQLVDIEIIPLSTKTLAVEMTSEATNLTEIVVKAELVRSSEAALLAIQRRASSIQDGVSSQQIGRTGSANAAEAIRQLPGAVVEDGRFIVVRGLGDRYSLSMLNGIILPGTDPYRNSSGIDMIPSQMINSITTSKTFTPDHPGNFTGGLVNIETKSIPDRFTFSVNVNGGFNDQSSLRNTFISSTQKGKWDLLGMDDGSRNQPSMLLNEDNRELLSSSTYLVARQPSNTHTRDIFDQSSKQLSNQFVPHRIQSPLNTGLNLSVGNRFRVFNNELGFIAAVNYSNTYQHYENGIVSTYINTNTDFLFPYQDLRERKSVHNPSLGGLANLMYKLGQNHVLHTGALFNNDAEITSREQTGTYLGQVSNSRAEFNAISNEFVQRQSAQYRLGGRHTFDRLNESMLEWNISRTNAFQKEPDLTYFAYTKVCDENGAGEVECQYYINNAEIAFPYHFFRDLRDNSWEVKLDLTIPLSQNVNQKTPNEIKFGGMFSKTVRNFSEYRYQLNNSGVPSSLNFTRFKGNFDAFFDLDNFGIIDTLLNPDGTVNRYVTGYHYINQINARNFYTGHSQISSVYAMITLQPLKDVKFIGGLRLEHTNMEVVSKDTMLAPGSIRRVDVLPSVNLVYSISEKSGLRAAFSQTLARPNMRELAPFVQFDTKNGFFNVGNPNLKQTSIQNLDLRIEHYPDHGEMIAAGAFLKIFNNPIIRAFNPKATIPELSFINVDEAMVYGIEFECRKNLSFLTPLLQNFYLNANLALIYSSYNIPPDEIQNSQNIDPGYDQTTRPFQGQAPYIVNTILSYINPEQGWEASMAYNVSGPKLYSISLFATPDVYEQPFSLLNFKVSKRLSRNFQISLTGRNLLNAYNRKTLSFRGSEYIAEASSPGRTVSFAIRYDVR